MLRRSTIIIVLLSIAAFGLHVVRNDFVMLDDRMLILENPFVREWSPWSLRMVFATYDPELYVPLTLLAYQILHAVFGPTALPFHLASLSLHLGSSLLVFAIVQRLSHSREAEGPERSQEAEGPERSRGVALVVASLFAIHPLQTEAVLWASALKDVFSGFLFLAALLLYLRYREEERRWWYGWSLVLFCLALLSKVSVLMLPVVLLLIHWKEREPLFARRTWVDLLPFFALSMLFGIVALFGKAGNIASSDFTTTVLLAAKSTLFYLWKFFLPLGLSPVYPQGPVDPFSPEFLAISAGAVLLLLSLVSLVRLPRAGTFGLALYLVLLVPNFGNFLKNGFLFFGSDRYAYLASIGVFYGFAEMLRARSLLSTATVIVCLLAGVTFAQGFVWKDTETLFRHVLKHSPNATVILIDFADELMRQGHFEEGKDFLERATAQGFAPAHLNLGTAYRARGEEAMAEEEYRKAIAASAQKSEIAPLDLAGYYFLGTLYEAQGKRVEALQQFATAIARAPDLPDSYFNLGQVLQERGERTEARTLYEKALAIDPAYASAHYALAGLLAEEGHLEESLQELSVTLELQPRNIRAREHLQNIRRILGR